MKIGIVQTAHNNCAALDKLAKKYPGVRIVHYVDECLDVCLENGEVGTEKIHRILADDFNKLIEAGCESIGLLCSLVKPGIEKVRERVSLPILVYDDVQAERAVAVTPNGGKIAAIAMNTASIGPSKKAIEEAALRAGKQIEVEAICVESGKAALAETGDTEIADGYFERYLREHQHEYSAYVIPQVPLTRIMPKIRDMETPVFDSMEPFVEALAKG